MRTGVWIHRNDISYEVVSIKVTESIAEQLEELKRHKCNEIIEVLNWERRLFIHLDDIHID